DTTSLSSLAESGPPPTKHSRHCSNGSSATRLLFRVVLLVCKNHFRGTKLVFHLLAVANLSDPLENDPVVHTNFVLDDIDVVKFVLGDDLALMHHAIFVDNVNVKLGEIGESRPLRYDNSAFELSADHHGAGLTVTQQALWVRKIRAEGDVPVLVVELGLDRT